MLKRKLLAGQRKSSLPSMRFFRTHQALLLATALAPSRTTAFTRPAVQRFGGRNSRPFVVPVAHLSSGGEPNIQHIGRVEMNEILEDYEAGGRLESQYCVIDVRGEDEVAATGKLSPSVYTLPVQVIMGGNAFQMDPEDFEEAFGFEKPDLDETLVFSCAAGIRSVYACQFAAKAGYSKLVNYMGGANEWFSP